MVSNTSPRTPRAEIRGTGCGVAGTGAGRGASSVCATDDAVRATLADRAGGVDAVLPGVVTMLSFARLSMLSVGCASCVASAGLAGVVLLGGAMTG